MRGLERAEVREAILDAYDQRQLDRLLADRFDLRRDTIVADGPLRDVVEDVLDHFAREGRDAYLIAELAADRPRKPEIQTIYRRYAQALLDDAWRSRIDAESAARLERYGLLPKPHLEQRGAPMASHEPGESAFSGFQKLVHARLPELDVFLWSSQLVQQTYRVCRVEVRGVPRGTGFLVGPQTVLTCCHVVDQALRARAPGSEITCLFDFWSKPGGAASNGVRVAARGECDSWHIDSSPALSPTEEHAGVPEATDERLDHALIALERPIGDVPIFPGGPVRGWIEVPATAPTVTGAMPIAILHYPRSGPIKLNFDTHALQHINPGRTRLRYSTNTDEGSSGAPCFDVSLRLVGMHHFSDPHNRTPAYNQGIPIEAIQRRLLRRGLLGALAASDAGPAAGFEARPPASSPTVRSGRSVPGPVATHDLCLSYAPAEEPSARALQALLQGHQLQVLTAELGDRRGPPRPAARATVILISSGTDPAWARGEIAAAIPPHGATSGAHQIVALLLDPAASVPDGIDDVVVLRSAAAGLAGAAARLRELVATTSSESRTWGPTP